MGISLLPGQKIVNQAIAMISTIRHMVATGSRRTLKKPNIHPVHKQNIKKYKTSQKRYQIAVFPYVQLEKPDRLFQEALPHHKFPLFSLLAALVYSP